MVWETPTFLFALWLAPLIGGLFVYAHRKRKATAATFAEAAMVERLMPPFESGRVWGKTIVMTLAVAFLIVACARPRFGVFF
ncbi:MAG: Ca-activated chloride channel family protein, partial [Porticoccaceae bacterium]